MLDELLICFPVFPVKEIAGAKHFRPHGDVVAQNTISALGQCLRNPCRSGESVEHRFRIHFPNQLEDVGKELQLRARILDAFCWRGVDGDVGKQ